MWLTRMAFITWQVDKEGADQISAEQEWERQLQLQPESRQDRVRNRLLIDVEVFVVSLQYRDQSEKLEYGHKDEKSPTDHTLNQRLAWMGKGHASFGRMANELGLHGALDKAHNGHASSSKPTDPGQLAALEQQEVEAKRKKEEAEAEEKTKEAAAKRKDRAFDESGARSTLETDFQELGNKLVARTQKLHEDIKSLDVELDKDELKTEAATKLKSAISLMKGRHAMLVVAMGDGSESVEENAEAWNAYNTSQLITVMLTEKREPYENMASVKCMTAAVLSLGVFTLTIHDDIKAEKSRMKDITQVWEQMLNRVKEQKNRVRAALTRLIKAKQFEDAKQADMATKAAETTEAKAARLEAIKKAAARKSASEHKKAAT